MIKKKDNRQVPEGLSSIESLPTNRQCQLALRVNYPNAFDMFFFFKQKTAYEIPKRDWSSDVCLPISFGLRDEIGRRSRGDFFRAAHDDLIRLVAHRSEERRVGKECRSRWAPYH